jgi:maleamate amidohydrolase
VEGLEPWEGEVVVLKKLVSAFFGISLASLLVTMGVNTLAICWASTSGCVRVICSKLSFRFWRCC